MGPWLKPNQKSETREFRTHDPGSRNKMLRAKVVDKAGARHRAQRTEGGTKLEQSRMQGRWVPNISGTNTVAGTRSQGK